MHPLIAAYKKYLMPFFNAGMSMCKMPNFFCFALFNYKNY